MNWTASHRRLVTVNSAVFHGKLPDNGTAFAAGTLREVYLLHELIDQIIQPVASFSGAKDLLVTEQPRRFGNVELRCLSVNREIPQSPVAGVAPSFAQRFRTQLFCAFTWSTAQRYSATVLPSSRIRTWRSINVISYSGKVAITGHTEKLEVDRTAFEQADPQSEPDSLQQAHAMVMAGHKIKGDVPSYPYMARDRHISGTVVLFAVIDKTGHIQYLVPIGSPDDSLSKSAQTAVKTWTYIPYLFNGQPTEVDTTITVNYNLSPLPF